jgi:hypothetical protein
MIDSESLKVRANITDEDLLVGLAEIEIGLKNAEAALERASAAFAKAQASLGASANDQLRECAASVHSQARIVLIMLEQKFNRLSTMRDGLAAEAAKRGLTRLQ